MIREINQNVDNIEVILNDGTVLKFYAEHSEYEDCVNILLLKDSVISGIEKFEVKEVFVGGEL